MRDLSPVYLDKSADEFTEPRADDKFINNPDVSFDSISDLMDYDIANSPRTKTANVLGFYNGGDGGGGTFYWDSSEDKANHNGVDIIDPSHTATIGATAWYSDENTGTGCWKRKDKGYLWFREAGAKADGSDDHDAMEAAIRTSKKMFGHDGDEYTIGSSLTHDGDVYISAVGRFTIKPTGAFEWLTLDNTVAASTTLNDDATAGDYEITLADNSSVQEGDIIIMQSDTLWPYENRGNLFKGETTICKEVKASNVISLKYSLNDTYDVSAETVTVRIFRPKKFHLSGFDVDYGASTNTSGATIKNYVDSELSFGIENSYGAGTYLYGCIDSEVKNYSASKINDDANGYGVWLGGCLNVHIHESDFYNCRAPIDYSSGGVYGPTRNCHGYNNSIDGSGTSQSGNNFEGSWTGHRGIGTHGPAEFCSFHDNHIKNVLTGITNRGKDIRCYNNTFSNVYNYIFDLVDGTNFKAWGNEKMDITYPNKTTALTTIKKGFGAKIASDYLAHGGITVIKDNTLQIEAPFVFFEGDISNFYCKNNEVDIYDNGGINDVFDSGGVTISDSDILGNTIYSTNGVSYTLYKNITFGDNVREDIENRNHQTVSSLTISDDTVVAVTPFKVDGLMILSGVGGTSSADTNAVLHYKCDALKATEVGSGSLTTVSTVGGAPSGASGVDGEFTIYVSNDGNIYLNNRLGGAVSVYYSFIS